MRNFVLILLALSMASCGLLRKKAKTISEIETVLAEEKNGQEISNDSSETVTHSRITYGGENPFKTPEALLFAKNLFALSSLNLSAGKLDSALNALKKQYNDFSNTGSALSGKKTEDTWTKETKGSAVVKNTAEKKTVTEQSKVKEIEKDSLFQSIPWYVWLGALIIFIGLVLFIRR